MNSKSVIKWSFLGMMIGLISCHNNRANSTKNVNLLAISTDSINPSAQVEKTTSFPTHIEILLPQQYRKESQGYPKEVNKKE